jgi:hypothetical protein
MGASLPKCLMTFGEGLEKGEESTSIKELDDRTYFMAPMG